MLQPSKRCLAGALLRCGPSLAQTEFEQQRRHSLRPSRAGLKRKANLPAPLLTIGGVKVGVPDAFTRTDRIQGPSLGGPHVGDARAARSPSASEKNALPFPFSSRIDL